MTFLIFCCKSSEHPNKKSVLYCSQNTQCIKIQRIKKYAEITEDKKYAMKILKKNTHKNTPTTTL